MQERKPNPLALAINYNNAEEIVSLLEQKNVLESIDLWDAFSNAKDITKQTLEIIEKYRVLPNNMSISTLKMHLYLKGNRNISVSEFINESDLDVGQCPGFVSPMEQFTYARNIAGIKTYLISIAF